MACTVNIAKEKTMLKTYQCIVNDQLFAEVDIEHIDEQTVNPDHFALMQDRVREDIDRDIIEPQTSQYRTNPVETKIRWELKQ